MSRRDDFLDRERGRELRRQGQLFKHLGWRSPYAPKEGCTHHDAVEIENEEPIEHPDPLPDFWFPMRLRHWVCANCGTAVNPHAFRPDGLHPLSEETVKTWWDDWRAYETSINRPATGNEHTS